MALMRFTILLLLIVCTLTLGGPASAEGTDTTVPVRQITPKYAATVLRRVENLVRENIWSKQLLPPWEAELARTREDICASATAEELTRKINKLLETLKSSHCTLFYKHAQGPDAAIERVKVDRATDNPERFRSYPERIRKSARVEKHPEGSIGYVHLWCCDSEESADAFRSAMLEDLQNTDALVLDIRDGLGGKTSYMYRDLNILYTSAQKSYPPLTVYSGMATIMYHRNGTISVFAPVGSRTLGRYFPKRDEKFVYTKPIVLLTNKGSASCMEILAYIMQKTGRATLMGETTMGAVLGARMYDLDNDWALYLPVQALEFGHHSLEGVGVSPDVVVVSSSEKGKDPQLDEAMQLLRKKLTDKAASQN
jgi:C-terminal processing protease CtpA/Prc